MDGDEMMKRTIGSYEAKTRLPMLLRQVRTGKCFTITHRGQAVADLVPSNEAKVKDKASIVEKLKAFMHESPIQGVNIKKLLEEGRA